MVQQQLMSASQHCCILLRSVRSVRAAMGKQTHDCTATPAIPNTIAAAAGLPFQDHALPRITTDFAVHARCDTAVGQTPHLLLEAPQHDAAAERVAADEDWQIGAKAWNL
jgi:hypothetical protein